MDGSVKFSILVPVYKVEAFIRECIDSVLSQSYGNFELILVDDGSPDRSGDICEEYAANDSRIRVFHKPNGGLMSARRYAIEKATGDYYIFLDSDDYIASNTLALLADSIERFGADCIIYGFNWLKPGSTEQVLCKGEYANRLITDKAEVLNIVMNDSSYNSLCRKCVKASCFDGRDFSSCFHIKSGEDRIQSEEILENAQSFLFIPDALYYYRVNQTSITHTVSYDGYKADFTVEERSLELVKRLNVFSESDYDRMRNLSLDSLAIELKRICRFCSDRENTVRAFDCIKASAYYRDFLSPGYRKAPAIPGAAEISGVRRVLNRLLISLLRSGSYSLIILISKYIYK